MKSAIALLGPLLLLSTVAHPQTASTGAGQAYPAKPVRIILPYLGSTEFAGRWLAAKLSPALGQQVVVDPRPGAGGKIGHELAARPPPTAHRAP